MLSGYIQKYETGNIITIQTYCSTSQNEFSDAMKLRLKSLDKRNPLAKRLISNYKVYASLCAQYHLRLKEIFQELTRLGVILNNISKDWKKSDNPKSNSMFFIEGIWNPEKKMLYTSNIKQMLESFELCIRDFEQCLIKCVIAYTDLNNAEQKYKDSSRHLKTEGNVPNYYCYNTPTDNILLQKRLFQTDRMNSSDMQNPMLRLLSEPAPDEHRSPKFGKTMSHLNLNNNSRTPRNGGKTPPLVMSFISNKKIQETSDTLLTSAKNSSRVNSKGGVEVRPWAESKIEMLKSNKKRDSGVYMTPVPLQKNFSFRTADTNVSSRGAMTNDSYAEVHRRCSHLIKMYSGSGSGFGDQINQIRQQTTAGKPPRDMTGTSKKENMHMQSNYNTPRPSSTKQASNNQFGKRTTERRLETEPSVGSGGVDQLKNLFQQSKFVKGNIGLSSKLLKVR